VVVGNNFYSYAHSSVHSVPARRQLCDDSWIGHVDRYEALYKKLASSKMLPLLAANVLDSDPSRFRVTGPASAANYRVGCIF
jgi:hypothetical protein